MKKAWMEYVNNETFPLQVGLLIFLIIFCIGGRFGFEPLMVGGGFGMIVTALFISCIDDADADV